MLVLIKLLAVYMAAMGIVLVLNPDTLKRFIAFFVQGKRLYLAGVIRVLVAVILLNFASQCKIPPVVFIFGVLAGIKAIFIFLFGLEKSKAMLGKWEKKPASLLRLWGVVALIAGVVLFYSV